jgi:hypothetical protein
MLSVRSCWSLGRVCFEIKPPVILPSVHYEPLTLHASGCSDVARTRASTNPGITEVMKTVVIWQCRWRLGGHGGEDSGLI